MHNCAMGRCGYGIDEVTRTTFYMAGDLLNLAYC